MIDITKGLDQFASQVIERRKLVKRAGITAAIAAASGTTFAGRADAIPGTTNTVTVSDAETLNFALNLEYLEAEYYVRGVTGQPLSAFVPGLTGTVITKPASTQVQFTSPQLAGYFSRIAADEIAHVQFILAALSSAAVPEPTIDLYNSFNTAAQAANLVPAGGTFDPYGDEIKFLIGAYIFEDVGVTAYAGGAAYINDPDNIAYAASVLAMEGYHAGAIRGYLAANGGGAVTNAISALRATLSGAQDDNGTDLSASGGNPYNIINADASGQCFRRTFNQVLNVVYANSSSNANAGGGLFFPLGMNGAIKSATDTFVPAAAG